MFRIILLYNKYLEIYIITIKSDSPISFAHRISRHASIGANVSLAEVANRQLEVHRVGILHLIYHILFPATLRKEIK